MHAGLDSCPRCLRARLLKSIPSQRAYRGGRRSTRGAGARWRRPRSRGGTRSTDPRPAPSAGPPSAGSLQAHTSHISIRYAPQAKRWAQPARAGRIWGCIPPVQVTTEDARAPGGASRPHSTTAAARHRPGAAMLACSARAPGHALTPGRAVPASPEAPSRLRRARARRSPRRGGGPLRRPGSASGGRGGGNAEAAGRQWRPGGRSARLVNINIYTHRGWNRYTYRRPGCPTRSAPVGGAVWDGGRRLGAGRGVWGGPMPGG